MSYPNGYFLLKVYIAHYVHYGFCGSANKGHLLHDTESSKASGHFEK